MSVISQLVGVIVKFSIIVKICKYRGFRERHPFISMVIEVHGTFGHDMNCFIRECVCLFHDRQSRDHLFLFFCIQFFR
jgi:hypothetical protein